METYFYKCEVCGFLHIVPAYWVEYSPPEVYEMDHLNPENGNHCEQKNLALCK